MVGIGKFFYKLFRLEYDEPICLACEVYKDTCDLLRIELENERHEKRRLLDKLLFPPEEPKEIHLEEPKPVMPRHSPWHVQRAILEREDREKARILAEFAALDKKADPKKTIDELEKELQLAQDIDRGPSGGVVVQLEPLSEKDFEEIDASKVS